MNGFAMTKLSAYLLAFGLIFSFVAHTGTDINDILIDINHPYTTEITIEDVNSHDVDRCIDELKTSETISKICFVNCSLYEDQIEDLKSAGFNLVRDTNNTQEFSRSIISGLSNCQIL